MDSFEAARIDRHAPFGPVIYITFRSKVFPDHATPRLKVNWGFGDGEEDLVPYVDDEVFIDPLDRFQDVDWRFCRGHSVSVKSEEGMDPVMWACRDNILNADPCFASFLDSTDRMEVYRDGRCLCRNR